MPLHSSLNLNPSIFPSCWRRNSHTRRNTHSDLVQAKIFTPVDKLCYTRFQRPDNITLVAFWTNSPLLCIFITLKNPWLQWNSCDSRTSSNARKCTKIALPNCIIYVMQLYSTVSKTCLNYACISLSKNPFKIYLMPQMYPSLFLHYMNKLRKIPILPIITAYKGVDGKKFSEAYFTNAIKSLIPSAILYYGSSGFSFQYATTMVWFIRKTFHFTQIPFWLDNNSG